MCVVRAVLTVGMTDFLSRRDFDFGIAAGRGCLNSIYDMLDMETKLRPLLLTQYNDCDLPAGKILLVT
jgi:hypothetical protein